MADFLSNLELLLANPNVSRLLEVAIGIVAIFIVARILKIFLTRYIKNTDARYRVRKIITFVSYVIIILFTASVFSDRLGQLTVVLGVVGAGIAFALQEVIASFAGWVALSLGQFYKPGHRVQLGGIVGDVIDISILRTTLMECGDWVKADLYNGRIVRVANSFVFKEPVYNYSGDFPFLWDEISIPVKYGCDRAYTYRILSQVTDEVFGDYIPLAQAEWQKMVGKYLIEDAQIEPMITLVANDNWMEYRIRFVVDYKRRRGKKSELFNRILDEVEKSDGRIVLASATFELVGAPALDVRFSRTNNSR
ncbi:MAG: mechanosensitive ion channel domain-containing protein [Cyanobacteria bacterium P01_G01_bin.39]